MQRIIQNSISRHPVLGQLLVLLCWLLLTGNGPLLADENAEGIRFFESRIRPVLVERCFKCHSQQANPPKGKLRLDFPKGWLSGGESGPALVAGKPAESLIVSALKYEDYKMPPGGKLPAVIVKDFASWIKMGAPTPVAYGAEISTTAKNNTIDWQKESEFWSFKPITKYPLPQVNSQLPVRNEIDNFVFQRLADQQLLPAGQADRRTLIRRLTFNLLGLPPTPEEINSFIANKDPQAYAKLVDRLLESPHYGERWGRHWLDVVRYANSNGADENKPYPLTYHYRNYVIDAFNQDRPFNQFIREQIAGDLLPAGDNASITNQRITATTFLAMGIKISAEQDADKKRSDIIDEQIDTISRSMLGMTVACARCHDHKFDPIPTTDYYAMAGVLQSTQLSDRTLVSPQKATLKSQLQTLRTQLDQTRQQADARITQLSRQNVAGYLGGSLDVLKWQRHAVPADLQLALADDVKAPYTPTATTASLDQISTLYLVREAESFDRGTAGKVDGGYGKGIGIVSDKGASLTWVEYDLDVPEAGNYQVEFRYAAKDSRPGKLSINGKVVNDKSMAQTTGSWFPDTQKWFVEGRFSLQAGKNVLRFEVAPTMSHLDKIIVAPVAPFFVPASEAESLARGNVKPFTSGDVTYISDPPSGARTYFCEYDLDVKQAGPYQLLLRYAALESRPMVLTVDGQVKSEKAVAQVTGGWDATHQRWHKEIQLQLAAGKHTIRFHRQGAVSHIDQWRLIPVATGNDNLPAPEQIASSRKLNVGALYQWSRFLGRTRNTEPAFKLWQDLSKTEEPLADFLNQWLSENQPPSWLQQRVLTPRPKSIDQLAQRYQQVLTKALRQPPAEDLPALHKFLTGKDGPFVPYRHPLTHYEAAEQQAVQQQVAQVEKLAAQVQAIATVKVMAVSDSSVKEHPVFIRGSHLQKGPVVPRRFLTIVAGHDQAKYPQDQSGRLQLANSIASPRNPLTARVIANRVWRWHFGRALVKSTENFGHSGKEPSHPQLLDHLALKLIEFDWSIKQLNRYILASHAYQMASSYDQASAKTDPENGWYWRYQPQRLEAEVIRDTLLFTAGRLDLSLGGAPTAAVRTQDPSPKNLQENRQFYESSRRRSVYLPIVRTNVYKLFTLFDFPNPAAPTGNRTTTTIPTQALFLMNNPWMQGIAQEIAQQATSKYPNETARLKYLFESLLGRPPTATEITEARELIKAVRAEVNLDTQPLADWEIFCHTLLLTSEFIYLH
jgi:hypothetical protein